jgi:hypothetical protein
MHPIRLEALSASAAAPPVPLGAEFNGPAYDHDADHARLTGQILRVHGCMIDGVWRTLGEIEGLTGDPQASISAQLRHLRKKKFGRFIVEKRPRGDRELGLWAYRLLPPSEIQDDLPLLEEER